MWRVSIEVVSRLIHGLAQTKAFVLQVFSSNPIAFRYEEIKIYIVFFPNYVYIKNTKYNIFYLKGIYLGI